jgi:hypothetical protein
MARLFNPFIQVEDGNGNPLSGAKLNTYFAGTTQRKVMYSDSAMTTQHTNPIVADSTGTFPAAFGTGLYKLVLTDANDAVIRTYDRVSIDGLGDYAGVIDYDEGDGTTSVFALHPSIADLTDEAAINVQIANVTEHPDKYTLSSGNITFAGPPPKGARIVYRPVAIGATGQDGAAATIAVGTVTTGAAGSSAAVTNAGTSAAATFNFTIPRGDKGDTGSTGATGAAATIAVGTVTTGAAGSSATVTNVGTSSAATFNFTIPRGDPGTGDVTGPASSVDGYMAVFNGTTGKLLKSGGAPFANPMTTMGDMIIGGASGAPFRLALGGPTQFLGSNGSTPVWESIALADLPSQADLTVLARDAGSAGVPSAVSTPMLSVIKAANAAAARAVLGVSGGSGWVPISKINASAAATVEFTSGIDATYAAYVIVCVNLSVGTGSQLWLRVRSGGSWQTSNYGRAGVETSSANTTTSNLSTLGTGATRYELVSISSSRTGDGMLYLFNPATTDRRKRMKWMGLNDNGTSLINEDHAGFWNGGNGAVTGIQFLPSSGDITGDFYLFGIVRGP